MVSSSRHVTRYYTSPDPVEAPEAYVDSVLSTARRTASGIVIPTDDATMLACVRAREVIQAELALAAPPTSALLNVRDKRANLDTARRLGIPCPAQFELGRVDQIPELVDSLRFPMVLKNPGPAIEGERPRFDFRWLVARDERELRDHLARHCGEGAYPLFQELVTGTVHNVCTFAIAGEVIAEHEYVSIRRLQGSGVFRKVIEASPELVRYAKAMLAELGWDGPAHLGFFVREAEGDIRYMETNGRFWASVEGSIRAGWDFPAWTYDYFASGTRPVPGPLQVGSLTCWHLGDLQALIEYLAGGPSPGSSPPGRLHAVLDYISGFRPGVHSDTFRLTDPVPALVEHARLVRRGVSRLAALSSRKRLSPRGR
jgi:predicted ATP-grasp superfamily ATP-dependent carboligase